MNFENMPELHTRYGYDFVILAIKFICFWLFEIPLAWALAHPLGLGPTGVFIAVTAGFSLLAVVSLFVFRGGRWKTKRI